MILIIVLILFEIIFLKLGVLGDMSTIDGFRYNAFFDIKRVRLGGKEASYVALLFSLFSASWYSLSDDKNKFYKIIILCCIGFILIYSPIVFLPILIAIIFDYTFKVYSLNPLHNLLKRYLNVSLTTYFFIILLLIFLGTRINNIFSLSETSAIIRIIAPPLLMVETISQYPLWGIGLSSMELIKENIIEVYRDVFSYNIVKFEHGITNSFFLFIIYYGIIGTIILYYCLKYIEKSWVAIIGFLFLALCSFFHK